MNVIQTGLLNGTIPVLADLSLSLDGGYQGSVQVTLGTSSYSLVPGFVLPPGLVGSATPWRAYQVFPPGTTLPLLLLPEALAVVAAAAAAGDTTTAITAYL